MKLRTLIAAALLAVATQAYANDGAADFCDVYASMVEATADMRDGGMTLTQVINVTSAKINMGVEWERMLYASVAAATAELYTHPVLSKMNPLEIKQVAFAYCMQRQAQ